jgi:hypothetical protein
MGTQKAAKTSSTSGKKKSLANDEADASELYEEDDSLDFDDEDEDDDDFFDEDTDESDALSAVSPVSDDPQDANNKLFREDPILDRRIIEGMLRDKNVFLEEMAREGYSANAVLKRAAELGLSEALIRQVKGVAADLAGERPGRRPAPSSLGARTCLSCDRVFLSSGPGNRLCMRCRGGDAGLAQW